MFTGIVEELGVVQAVESKATGARIVIRCSTVLSDAVEGCSIAVNGVCLTALDLTPHSFAADLAPETLARTNLGDLHPGSHVNLERPVTPATRLSGHIMQGHVDSTAEIAALDDLGQGNWWVKIHIPRQLAKFMVHKGSIAVDGISLTIASLEDQADGALVGITIIPHTLTHTTLGGAKIGTRVNIEVDVLAKHVERLLAYR